MRVRSRPMACRSTGSSSSLTRVISLVSSGMRCWAMTAFSLCSTAANSLTCCPSPIPRSNFPSIAIAVSSVSSRPRPPERRASSRSAHPADRGHYMTKCRGRGPTGRQAGEP